MSRARLTMDRSRCQSMQVCRRLSVALCSIADLQTWRIVLQRKVQVLMARVFQGGT